MSGLFPERKTFPCVPVRVDGWNIVNIFANKMLPDFSTSFTQNLKKNLFSIYYGPTRAAPYPKKSSPFLRALASFITERKELLAVYKSKLLFIIRRVSFS